MRKQYISDIIKKEQIESWKPDVTVIISAQTGRGKSHFIKNDLYNYAVEHDQKILLLTHRNNCRDQFQMELEEAGKLENVTLMNYQKLDWDELYQYHHELDKYDYVCCDEFHYFISDAKFNKTTDLSFNTIIRASKPVKIFMSATPDSMMAFMRKYKDAYGLTYYKEYRLPFDYGFIDELVFYTSDDCLNTYARRAIENGTKTLFFINDIDTAISLFRRYRDKALFNCSPANVKAYKSYVDEVKIRNMLKNERFEENLLITTTVMDCGVNLKDMDIKEIVMDVKDVDSLQQCIGRKRILDQVDKVKIYIKFYDNRVINGLKSSAVFGIEHANYLRKYGEEAYEKRYPREPDRSGIVYMINKQYRINELMYFKRKRDVEIWDEVMRPDGEKKMNMGGVNIWQKNWEDIMKITIGMITKWTVKSHYLNFLKIWSRIK